MRLEDFDYHLPASLIAQVVSSTGDGNFDVFRRGTDLHFNLMRVEVYVSEEKQFAELPLQVYSAPNFAFAGG
jgi:hypothetical protein